MRKRKGGGGIKTRKLDLGNKIRTTSQVKVVLIKFPELEGGMQESIQVNSEYLFTSRFLREGENQFEIFLNNFPIPTPVASKCGPSCISPSWDHFIPTTFDAHYSYQPGKWMVETGAPK